MLRLLYVSAARIDLTDTDLQSILVASRLNNARDGLSGLLLYGNDSFVQVLEGEEAALDACYARIATDTRHSSLIGLMRFEVDRRLFTGWSMGYARLDPADESHEAFINLATSGRAAIAGIDRADAVLAFMSTFYDNNIATAPKVRRADAPA